MSQRVLGIIGARGGSKGIPGKNIKWLAGKPLIAYAIEAAKAAKRLTRCIVSTDDPETMAVARQFGADVPFQRPDELATDTALQIDALTHAVRTVGEQGDAPYDVVIVIQPTAPLRTADDIDEALSYLETSGADSVVSVTPVDNVHPYLMYAVEQEQLVSFIKQDKTLGNRQAYPDAFVRNGAIYAVKRDYMMANRTLIGDDCRAFLMPPERTANLDTMADWDYAEFLLKRRQNSELRHLPFVQQRVLTERLA